MPTPASSGLSSPSGFAYSRERFQQYVEDALAFARTLGATDAAAEVSEGVGLSVSVRKGEVENVERNRDKSMGITVYVGQRRGNASTSDFSRAALEQTVRAAHDIARFTAEDPAAGLPETEDMALGAASQPDLDLFHPWAIDAEAAMQLALRCESAALAVDRRITNSEGAGVSAQQSHFYAGNSRGFGRKEAQRQLEELHRKLLETTRQAGMAEVATGVLHNVGNVLNSVNVSATVLAESVRNTKASSISRVVELLEINKADLPGLFAQGGKGQMLPDYLATLSQQIAAEQKMRLSELSQLTKNIAHIKDIVAMQQNYAKITGIMELYPARSLLDEAVQLATADNKRDGVALEVACPANCPDVYVDRHKVMQILINLLTNARQAMYEQSPKGRIISVTITHNADKVRISVRDNGSGISPENLTLIFNHGFTTKKTGHGFGLHSSANSAKEMGGQLFAESEGMGHGSTFNLELPIRNPASTTAVAQTSTP